MLLGVRQVPTQGSRGVVTGPFSRRYIKIELIYENKNEQKKIADLILHKLQLEKNSIKASYESSSKEIGYFCIDNLLPYQVAKKSTIRSLLLIQ